LVKGASLIVDKSPCELSGIDLAGWGCKVTEENEIKPQATPGQTKVDISSTPVRGVQIYRFPWIRDPRGDLTVSEFGKDFPFIPKRHFIVFGVSPGTLRGEHAHKNCHQLLICAQGQCKALVDDGIARRTIVLDNPSIGIYVPPMIWGTQYDYSNNGSLLVFSSEHYDPNDYIRSYAEFKNAVAKNTRT
jgi:dTDP-4-dehydrorhamnose 3,5-epimerase-like enzyme